MVKAGSMKPIDLDRPRNVTFGRIARKPAPMLVPDTLTVKMTVKIDRATWNDL
jgi:hypothetical protein